MSRVTGKMIDGYERTVWLGTSKGVRDMAVLVFVRAVSQQRMTQLLREEAIPKATVIVEYLEVEAEWFNGYMKSREPLNAGRLRGEVQDQLTKEAARVLGITSATGPTGEELVVDGTEERIYPTEYDPGQIPIESPSETQLWPPGAYPQVTAHQTRNLGLSVKARVSDSGLTNEFEISASPYLLEDVGDRAVNELITPQGKIPLCTMPLFLGMSIDTTVLAHPGEIVLLGVCRTL
ncbi:hypothetical protein N9260_00395 [bacterium]|nr:hypothetical protein [bacterium]